MKIHKEGYPVIAKFALFFAAISVLACYTLPDWAYIPIVIVSVLMVSFCVRFFRIPNRPIPTHDNSVIYAPADGTIVAIEEVFEDEYLNENRIQVSIFMSIWNVHVNWFPVGGVIEYFKHHHGTFHVAWNPKSSTKNERTTTVVNTGEHKILFRQIAGYVARRIVNYANNHIGVTFQQDDQCGFIKFGSRVDLYLPTDSEILVKLDQKVVGTQTLIAKLPKNAKK